MFSRPQRTTVVHNGVEWTVSTIEVYGRGIETVAFEEGGQERQVYVSGATHEEAVERFRNVDYPALGHHGHV